MNPRQKRMTLVAALIVGVGVAITFALLALNENINHFYGPKQVKAGEAPTDHSFRLGGLVVDGSVVRDPASLKITFDLTDTAESITVQYEGILPDLFREGQGIVATGKMQNDLFIADEVLAKHDENYMPPEVADTLKDAGLTEHNGKELK